MSIIKDVKLVKEKLEKAWEEVIIDANKLNKAIENSDVIAFNDLNELLFYYFGYNRMSSYDLKDSIKEILKLSTDSDDRNVADTIFRNNIDLSESTIVIDDIYIFLKINYRKLEKKYIGRQFEDSPLMKEAYDGYFKYMHYNNCIDSIHNPLLSFIQFKENVEERNIIVFTNKEELMNWYINDSDLIQREGLSILTSKLMSNSEKTSNWKIFKEVTDTTIITTENTAVMIFNEIL